MSKLRSDAQLHDYLDREFAWRLKELANLRVAMRRANGVVEKSIIRATVCLAYAHWEGFIKNAARAYLEFVGLHRLKYNELTSCFVVFGVKSHVRSLVESRKAGITISAVDFFRYQMDSRAQLSLPSLIDTESNLSSSAFENLSLAIGIDPEPFAMRFHQIDEELLRRRNTIAHGEYLDIEPEACRELVRDVISLLRLFKDSVENAAVTKAYRIPVASR
jgi:hypothetical protein